LINQEKKEVEVEDLTEDDRNKLIQELDAVAKKYDKEIPKEEKEIYEIYKEILKMEILFTKM
jgi:signal transduction protein with GAF and PtsI domain